MDQLIKNSTNEKTNLSEVIIKVHSKISIPSLKSQSILSNKFLLPSIFLKKAIKTMAFDRNFAEITITMSSFKFSL